jgi:4'-phosphopantetheinyl transferase
MVWSLADLRSLDEIRVPPSEIVYAYVFVGGEPDQVDEALLDDEEADRSRRFVRFPDRRRFVLSHAALRLVLARCLGVSPPRVSYEKGPHGKPRLSRALAPLEFNLSHSGQLALVAVARDRSLGVDIEQVRDLGELLDLADQHFSPQERTGLRSLPPGERRAAFFRCWTRKEAVIKACGEGLSYPLPSFDVDLAPGSTSALRRYAGRSGSEAELSVSDLGSPLGYTAAGAVAASASSGLRWRELSI